MKEVRLDGFLVNLKIYNRFHFGIVADELIHSSNVNLLYSRRLLVRLQSGNGQNISRQIAKNSCNPDCTGTTINMVCEIKE